jgi:hypothetical protein
VEAKEVLEEWIRCEGMPAVVSCHGESPRWLRGEVHRLDPVTTHWVSETRAERVLRMIERVGRISATVGFDLDQEDDRAQIYPEDAAEREDADPSVQVPYLTSREILAAVRAAAAAALAEGAALESLRAAKIALKAARGKSASGSTRA